jgi:hypothetical protein
MTATTTSSVLDYFRRFEVLRDIGADTKIKNEKLIQVSEEAGGQHNTKCPNPVFPGPWPERAGCSFTLCAWARMYSWWASWLVVPGVQTFTVA